MLVFVASVDVAQARALTDTFLARFTGGVDALWWWEHFKLPVTSVHFSDGNGSSRIEAIVPDAHEKIWFVAEDSDLPFFPIYEATPAAAQQVIGECYYFEYYLIAKDLSWLLCENHHDTMIAIGTIRGRLAQCGV